MIFGQDGFHLVALTGPGNIWLQSMPVSGAGRGPRCPTCHAVTIIRRPTPASGESSGA